VVQGQKTGFFLDQRDNRARVEKLATGKRVLNVFAYTGGFSLYAARGGAKEVVSLDISQPALANAMRNFKLNRAHEAVAAAEHEMLVGDAFLTMKQLIANRRRFEMVIIDPPAFARRREEVKRAVTAYGRLVRLGLHLLQPGGILVMSSCSSRVSAEEFFELVHKTAAGVGRPLQEIERTGHALDHPITFAEGAYLKCLFAVAP
jgi:23S rRNA (cytosine1962-C5)-methyltransferase